MEASYTCDFGRGLKLTAMIDQPALLMGKGTVKFYDVSVEGILVPGAIPRYRDWMLMIHQAAADLVQGKVLWVFQYAPQHTQVWECAPGVEPKQIDVSKVIPRRKGKEGCKRCHGRGHVGRNFITKTLIVCSCVEET